MITPTNFYTGEEKTITINSKKNILGKIKDFFNNGKSKSINFDSQTIKDERDVSIAVNIEDFVKFKQEELKAKEAEIEKLKNPEKTSKYTVKPGDSYASIADRIPGVDAKAIRYANDNLRVEDLKPGMRIVIPTDETEIKPNTYTIKKGDNWHKIAKANYTTEKRLSDANNNKVLKVGEQIIIPEPDVHSRMKVDKTKADEYRKVIVEMIKAKGVTDERILKELPDMIIKNSFEQDVDPIMISALIGRETDYRYLNNKNIYKYGGWGVMQLTKSTVEDLYRMPSYYVDSFPEIEELKKKYKTADALWKAVSNKYSENHDLNMKLGIMIFKAKLEINSTNKDPNIRKDALKYAVRDYNGNVNLYWENGSKKQLRVHYMNDVYEKYNTYKAEFDKLAQEKPDNKSV